MLSSQVYHSQCLIASVEKVKPDESAMVSAFAQFMFKHKIPATAAAFSIGGASAEMAKIMTNDLVLPIVYSCVALLGWPGVKVPTMQFLPFFNALIMWVCVLVTSFFLMEILFSRGVLGASSVVLDTKEKAELSKAQDVAKQPIKNAAQAVKDMVGMVSGAPTLPELAEVPLAQENHIAPDHRRLSPGGPTALRAAPAEFNATL